MLALYSLYNTQICSPKVKIRITPANFKLIEELYELCKTSSEWVFAAEALRLLCAHSAFELVLRVSTRKAQTSATFEHMSDLRLVWTEEERKTVGAVLGDDELQLLSQLTEQYEKAKINVIDDMASGAGFSSQQERHNATASLSVSKERYLGTLKDLQTKYLDERSGRFAAVHAQTNSVKTKPARRGRRPAAKPACVGGNQLPPPPNASPPPARLLELLDTSTLTAVAMPSMDDEEEQQERLNDEGPAPSSSSSSTGGGGTRTGRTQPPPVQGDPAPSSSACKRRRLSETQTKPTQPQPPSPSAAPGAAAAHGESSCKGVGASASHVGATQSSLPAASEHAGIGTGAACHAATPSKEVAVVQEKQDTSNTSAAATPPGYEVMIPPIECQGCLESFNVEDIARDHFDLLNEVTFYCAECTTQLKEARENGDVESEIEEEDSSDSSCDEDGDDGRKAK